MDLKKTDQVDTIDDCYGFEWDIGNLHKNHDKHQVSSSECEEVFFNKPILLFDDVKHSKAEERYFVYGRTNEDRTLFIAYTIRNGLIRVISARDMSKKEKIFYEKKENSLI